MKFFSYFLRFIPTREQLAKHRATRWLAPWLGQRKLWHFSRRSVALGMAIGIFFGFLLPVAQIPLSASTAVVLRANVPAAESTCIFKVSILHCNLKIASFSCCQNSCQIKCWSSDTSFY